ncbi:MAG: SLOG family protein [Clostridia bacterium]|nr:SLOG family protein [Clostridia bacterium]
MKRKICTFAGHREIYDIDSIKAKLKNEIINLIENHGVTTFYNGGKGKFDWLCAECVKELKSDYPFIKSYLILAYIPTDKNKSDINRYDDFDDTIYPNLETIPPKYAIIKRNKWMIDRADFLITYIHNEWGGAYKTLVYARKHKNIVVLPIGSKI